MSTTDTTAHAFSPGEALARFGLAGPGAETWTTPAAHPPARAPGEEELVYKVFVLGARGSGKTVFLASLYNKLSTQDAENRFFIKPISERQTSSLNKVFAQIENSSTNWPSGTKRIDEYAFRCFHLSPQRAEPFPLFTFKYLDYPGGYVTDDMDETPDDRNEALDIEKQTQEAHSILVLLDGQKVFEQLEGYEGLGPSIDYDLNSIVPRLLAGAQKPVHFLVTKWDILKGLHSLDEVKQQLLKNQAFANFVQLRQAQSMPVHLVPVSAVGNDFAHFDPATKTMRKKKGGRVNPYNIEYSVGLTITDQLVLLGRRAVATGKIPLSIVKWLRRSVKWLRLIAWYLRVEEWGLPGIPFRLGSFRILHLLALLEQSLTDEEDALAKRVELISARIRDEAGAVESILEIQALRRKQLQAKYPASSLTEAAEKWT